MNFALVTVTHFIIIFNTTCMSVLQNIDFYYYLILFINIDFYF